MYGMCTSSGKRAYSLTIPSIFCCVESDLARITRTCPSACVPKEAELRAVREQAERLGAHCAELEDAAEAARARAAHDKATIDRSLGDQAQGARVWERCLVLARN